MSLGVADFEVLSRDLYTPVLSDVLDEMGYPDQAMRPFVRPLDDDLVLVGRARTGLYMEVFEVREGENPYAVEIALVDDLKPGDVAVLGCGGPSDRIAPWGELLSTASRARGAAGCVTDGLVRDVRHIRKMRFPVFHGGIGPLDSKGRGMMMRMDVPIRCAGVLVHAGDIVFGDVDGVVVIPLRIAGDVVTRARERMGAEKKTREELEKGMLLRQIYEKYNVL
jgi:regulator of RNase E activity RraA